MKQKANLTELAEQQITAAFECHTLPKGHFLFRQDELCTHLFFLEKGLARVYSLNESGKDITAWFTLAGSFTTAIDSFYQNIPTMNNCELLEKSVVYSLSYAQMQEMLNKNIHLARFAFHVVFEIAKRMTEHISSLKFQTAQERYQALLSESPLISQKVQLSYIASYLGISPETLSRLRSEK